MDISDYETKEEFSGFLFTHPTYFDVDYVINPYMDVDSEVSGARSNWLSTVRTVRKYSQTETIDIESFDQTDTPIDELPDAVFCANHAMPVLGKDRFILANMKHQERKGEIPYFRKWAEHNGFEIERVPDEFNFEGCGDAKWHPNHNVVWIGYGPRTDFGAVSEIRNMLDAKVIPLELTSGSYYHLDVCFTILDESTAIVVQNGLSDNAYRKIKDTFESVLHVPKEDLDTMGGNSARVSSDTVMIDRHNQATGELLKREGYKVEFVPTETFQKAGGSADCLFLRKP